MLSQSNSLQISVECREMELGLLVLAALNVAPHNSRSPVGVSVVVFGEIPRLRFERPESTLCTHLFECR